MDQEIVDIQESDGVGPVTAGKREAGYDSILAIAIAPIRELVDKASLEVTPYLVALARQTMKLADTWKEPGSGRNKKISPQRLSS